MIEYLDAVQVSTATRTPSSRTFSSLPRIVIFAMPFAGADRRGLDGADIFALGQDDMLRIGRGTFADTL